VASHGRQDLHDADAQRIAALAHQSDAAAVDATEQILSRYVLANQSIGANGAAGVMLGGAPRMQNFPG